ncbi:hypothetical protein FGG08_002478 [Glutinoglossum americanum]|uniref:RRM domain-containing protein n=1 Tax=Glutinoglossum americanum TaxID=1670608 RepID=A0A9P8I054_9PEZI|nr:hypothetical protein FGG08_002478 [Glutinoglossum americanum]
MPRAFLSTNLGQYPPRPLEEPLPSTIVRSNQELDKHVFGTTLRERWPLVCKLINHSFDVSDYFDDLDVHVQGREFLWSVLKQLAYENTIRRERITMFAMDWSRANINRFAALEHETEVVGFFTEDETNGVGEEWLLDVFLRLKDLKVENKGRRGSGVWARNSQGRQNKAPHPAKFATTGHRLPPQPYPNSQVTSPHQHRYISVTSPVYTPSMISSGSWGSYQPPMGQTQDGYQWMSVHSSPQQVAYRSIDSQFSQFSPPGGARDIRGPLPSPRFPPDLSQNAFGDPLHHHGSVAARRSRAPPRLKLDLDNARFDSVQNRTLTPPTPFTVASLAHSGYSHNTGPGVAFGDAGPMHHPRLSLNNMPPNHGINGSAWPVKGHPITHTENKHFPQYNRPNPVVNTHDPSYIPCDVRLLEPGPALHEPHHGSTGDGKFAAKSSSVENGLSELNPDELRFIQLTLSGEGSSAGGYHGQNTNQANQPEWSAYNNHNDGQFSSHSATPSEVGNTGRAPLFDSTNQAQYANTDRLDEIQNANYYNNRGLPHKSGSDPSCSVFVSHLPPNITREKLFDLFHPFGPVANTYLKAAPSCFAIINFFETNARNAAIAGLNGFVLDNHALVVEPKRPNREFTDRTTRKTFGNNTDSPLGPQAGNAPRRAIHRAHTSSVGVVDHLSPPRRDENHMTGQRPQPLHIQVPQQSENWTPDSATGNGEPSNSMRTRSTHGRIVLNGCDIGNSCPHPYHGDPTDDKLNFPPPSSPAAFAHGGHGSGGARLPKSPKKGKRGMKDKKYLRGQNRYNEGEETSGLRSPVLKAKPASRSGNASESGFVGSRDNSITRRSSL